MTKQVSIPLVLALACSLLTFGCRNTGSSRTEYQIGDKVPTGPLTYNVVERVWRSQLGEGFQIRVPQNRFLLVTLSATNGGGSEVSVPMLQLESADGKIYKEVESGEGVDNWFGLLRTIPPAQTLQGRLVFDVPLSTYRLRLSDGDAASGHFVYVQIPLQIDADPVVEPPTVGKQ
ncbi:MAG TPA: DUF4352 domain-containing protein [Bryobacteraceae bacterium]|nr:DUF4352 domain-containing protein [Bryobacteraceae bacterium]